MRSFIYFFILVCILASIAIATPVSESTTNIESGERRQTIIIAILTASLVLISLIAYRRLEQFKEIVQQKNIEIEKHKKLLRQSYDRIEQAKEKAEIAGHTQSAFIANMSHEFRTPLNAIIGFSELVMRSSDHLNTEDYEHLEIILNSGEHLLTMINQILDFSKLELGSMPVQKQDFDLFSLLDDLKHMFYFKAEEKGLDFQIKKTSDVPGYICTDEVKVRQILINLVNNALKFTESGWIQLRVTRLRSKKEDQIDLLFEIEDTGCGIPKEKLEQIFEAFYYDKLTESQEGTGLGLSISRKFVHSMGGQLKATSQLGKGTTFQLCLPITLAKDENVVETKMPQPKIQLEAKKENYRILIVDDKWTMRQLIWKALEPFHFELQVAENGKQALDIWEKWHPHFIWLDIKMPILDGYQTIQHIRRREKEGHYIAAKIVALTTNITSQEYEKVVELGGNDCLPKPFHGIDLCQMLEKYLDVSFTYQKDRRGKTKKIIKNSLPEKITVTKEWVTKLENAIHEADIQVIHTAIEEIREDYSPVAQYLSELAKNFQYEELFAYLDGVEMKP